MSQNLISNRAYPNSEPNENSSTLFFQPSLIPFFLPILLFDPPPIFSFFQPLVGTRLELYLRTDTCELETITCHLSQLSDFLSSKACAEDTFSDHPKSAQHSKCWDVRNYQALVAYFDPDPYSHSYDSWTNPWLLPILPIPLRPWQPRSVLDTPETSPNLRSLESASAQRPMGAQPSPCGLADLQLEALRPWLFQGTTRSQ